MKPQRLLMKRANAYMDFILSRLKDRVSHLTVCCHLPLKLYLLDLRTRTDRCRSFTPFMVARTWTKSSSTTSRVTRDRSPSGSVTARPTISSWTSTESSWTVSTLRKSTASRW